MNYSDNICRYDMAPPELQQLVMESAKNVVRNTSTLSNIDYALKYNHDLMRDELEQIAQLYNMPYDVFILYIYICASKADGTYFSNEEFDGFQKLSANLGFHTDKSKIDEYNKNYSRIKEAAPEDLIDISRLLGNYARRDGINGEFLTFVCGVFIYDGVVSYDEYELLARILYP